MRTLANKLTLLGAAALLTAACESSPREVSADAAVDRDANANSADAGPQLLDAATADADTRDTSGLPYARAVVSFTPGPGAGFGQASLPEVVLGPPRGLGTDRGSLDVLSLGTGGEIVLDFGPRRMIDGEGPDVIVFENAFWVGGDASQVWKELGQVAVSVDGESWLAWPCEADSATEWHGCAGWSPALAYDPFVVLPLDPELTGGNAFDLAELGVSEARYLRITDLAGDGVGPSAGFDLDAAGLIHWAED